VKKHFILLLIFFVIFISGCSSSNEKNNISVTNTSVNKQSTNKSPMSEKNSTKQNFAMKLYENTKYNFSIEIPKEFDYVSPKSPNIIMSAVDESHIANINILVRTIDEQITAEEFNNLVAEDPQSLNLPGEIIDRGIINTQNNKAAYVLCMLKGKSSDILLQQFYIFNKNIMFAISYVAPKKYFDNCKKSYYESIKTFNVEV
jgi:hypothetical protein